jgi:hypothetical protein
MTFGDFSVFFKSRSKRSNNREGGRFVARQETKHPQVCPSGFVRLKQTPLLSADNSLKPRTLNYTKLNNARRNLEWQQAEKELGLIQL